MVGRKKPIQIMLDIDDHWSLSRYAARENLSIRQVVRDQLMPLIDDLKMKFPREPNKPSSSIDDVQ